MAKAYDYVFKIVLIGDPGVGKTCILGRFATNQFYNRMMCTIGCDFQTRTIEINNKKVKLVLWDTAGQERFTELSPIYFRGAHGIIMVYDITNRLSFEAIANKWMKKVDNHSERNIVRVLAGTKLDQDNKRQVSSSEAEVFARDRDFLFLETSAKENLNIDELLMGTTHEILVTLFCDGLANQRDVFSKERTEETSWTSCCGLGWGSDDLSSGVHVDNIIPSDLVQAVTLEEKSLDALDYKRNMEALYTKNKTLFESYKTRSGWFISYKQDDGSDVLAERLYRDLGGDNWFDMYYNKTRTRAAMIKGILRRDKFICFVSPSYFKSQWCVIELTTAFLSGKTIVPVFNQDRNTAGSMLSSVPECFSDLKNEDFIGLFADTVPYRGQLNKVVSSGSGKPKHGFYDSEKETEENVISNLEV